MGGRTLENNKDGCVIYPQVKLITTRKQNEHLTYRNQ